MGAVMCGVEWWPYPTAVMRRCARIANHAGDHCDSQYLGRQNTWNTNSGGIHAPGPRAVTDPGTRRVLGQVVDAPTFHDDLPGTACGVFVAGTAQRCVLPEHHQGRHALPVETCPVTSSSGMMCAHYVGHDGAHGYTR